MMFAILSGLSMDHEVFLMTHVEGEEYFTEREAAAARTEKGPPVAV